MCHGRMVRFQLWSVCTPCGASPVLHAASVACVMEFSLVNRLLTSLSALCCILFCSRNRWNDKELDNVSLHGVYVLWAVLRPNSMQIAVRKFQRLIFGCAQAGDCNLGGVYDARSKARLAKTQLHILAKGRSWLPSNSMRMAVVHQVWNGKGQSLILSKIHNDSWLLLHQRIPLPLWSELTNP